MTLIFCLHYFLWYGAHTTIFGYESVYSRYYTNATPMQFGTLKMVLPFVAVIVTPIMCSIADRKRAHRTYFIIALLFATLSMVALCLLPLLVVPKRTNPKQLAPKLMATDQADQALLVGPFVLFSFASLVYELSFALNTCLSDSFAVLQAEESGTSFGNIIVWGTFGWALVALLLSWINQFSSLPRLIPGMLVGTLLLGIDLLVCVFWNRDSDFKLDIIPPSVAITLTGASSSGHRDPSDYQPLNETNRINMGTVEETVQTSEPEVRPIGQASSALPKMVRRRSRQTISPVDLLAGKRPHVVGQTSKTVKRPREIQVGSAASPQTLVSEIKTIHSDLGAKLVEPTKTKSVKDPNLAKIDEPVSSGNVLLNNNEFKLIGKSTNGNAIEHKYPMPSACQSGASFLLQMRLIGIILSRRTSLTRYLLLFVLSGFFMSMHWNYFFLYLEKIYSEKFELISGLSMVYQGILGELPFFILSRKLIDILGRSHTISLSLITISIRFLLYRFMLPNTSGFLTFVADCLQGPNYGLFYVVMTEVGLEYSYCDDEIIEYLAVRKLINQNDTKQVDSIRLALRSTVQSVAFACYEGLGVGLGGLVGGWILSWTSFDALWMSMSLIAMTVGLANIALELWLGEEESGDSLIEHEEMGTVPGEMLAKWPSDWRDFHMAQRSGQLETISGGIDWKGQSNTKKSSATSGNANTNTDTAAGTSRKGANDKGAASVGQAAAPNGTTTAPAPSAKEPSLSLRQQTGSQVSRLVADAVEALRIAKQAKSAQRNSH